MRMRATLALALLVGLSVAGCAAKPTNPADKAKPVDVSPETGGIRGVVVTPAIVPVADAHVAIPNGPATDTDASGLFTFGHLKPGEYFLTVSKLGYTTVQATATVEANVPEPPVVKVVVELLVGKQPYNEYLRFDGFYECGFSAGQPGRPLITDQCDMGIRTVYDAVNDTTGPPPSPRNVEHNVNTMFADVGATVETVIQEGFWKDSQVPTMMVNLDATPIDNSCDCSQDYITVTQATPTHGRLDNATEIQGQHVAIRGFLDWETVSTAQNFQFTIITTFFHNYQPAKDWTFESRDRYPIQ